MTAQFARRKETIHFTQWSRKSYAVFQSLGKIVHIGVILVSYSLIAPEAKAQESAENTHPSEETDTLPEVEITTSEPGVMMGLIDVPTLSTQPEQAGTEDASELALKLPGTDIRQRGINGVQGDISIRGSSPEQVQVLLNGVLLNDSQTGHHNLNLPVSAISIHNLQRYSPATGQQAGSDAFSGSLNFMNSLTQKEGIRLWLTGGQHKFIDISAAGDFHTGRVIHHLAVSHKSSEGHSDNTDFSRQNVYYHSRASITNKLSADIQAGYLNKSFGAEGFYSDAYPTQFEAIQTSLISGRIQKSGKVRLSATAWYRQNNDRFELFRESLYAEDEGYYIYGDDTARYIPGVYESWNYYSGHNYHRTRLGGYRFDVSASTGIGQFKAGINHRHEEIVSNVLGKPNPEPMPVTGEPEAIYSRQAVRDQINAALTWQSPELLGFTASLSGLMHSTGTYGTYYYGGARLQYRPTAGISLWSGINQSMRLPTFTDLYYNGPSNQGNPELLPEEAVNYELGIYAKSGDWNLRNQLFHQAGKNMIDWVRRQEETQYTTMNYTRMNTIGNELSLQWRPSANQAVSNWITSFDFHYTFMIRDKEEQDSLISAYALDYLRHQAGLGANHKLGKSDFCFSWRIRFNDRQGSYTLSGKEYSYDMYILADVKIAYHKKSWTAFIAADNITDERMRDFGNIRLAGRWIKAGIRLFIEK
ncbi:MAG: TonB-dependent receptor [Bacteroidales bacterium]